MKIIFAICVTLTISSTASAQSEVATARISATAASIQSIAPELKPAELKRVLQIAYENCAFSSTTSGEGESGSATARVAGFAAMLTSEFSQLTVEQVRELSILAFSNSVCGY